MTEDFGGELDLALLAAVIAAAEHTLTVSTVVQPWAAELGRVAIPMAIGARERVLLKRGEQTDLRSARDTERKLPHHSIGTGVVE